MGRWVWGRRLNLLYCVVFILSDAYITLQMLLICLVLCFLFWNLMGVSCPVSRLVDLILRFLGDWRPNGWVRWLLQFYRESREAIYCYWMIAPVGSVMLSAFCSESMWCEEVMMGPKAYHSQLPMPQLSPIRIPSCRVVHCRAGPGWLWLSRAFISDPITSI